MSTGSSITLGFTEETINDRSGVDFFVQTVPETAGEHADVYVSRNGIDFAFVTTVLQGGRIGVDVATAAIRDGIKYVRIVGKDLGGGSPGFDLMGVEAVIGNSPVTASFRYDVSGHVVEAIDAAGNKTTATYDSFGRIATRTDRAGNTTSYDYENGCPCGIPGAVTNPDGSVRRYEHNDFGQITAETVPVFASVIVRLRSVPVPPSDPSMVTRSAAFRRMNPPVGAVVLVMARATPVG